MKKVHFVGIKGVGMTPLAIIAKEAGWEVTGSDVAETFITDEALALSGITPFEGFSEHHITNQQLIITTGANGGYFNPEALAAKRKNIPVLAQGQALGEFMNGKILGREFEGISVAGSHGKTTTCAMLATIFKYAHVDPSYVIGTSSIPTLGLPGHLGNGRFFVAEADEYATEPKHDKTPKLLWQHPKIVIITNIELDHPDLYASIEQVRDVYLQFVRSLPSEGTVIACGDELQILHLLKEYKGNVITYGSAATNDVIISQARVEKLQTYFTVSKHGQELGQFSIHVSGIHNSFNASAALIAALECGVPLDKISKALANFCGSKRRFEYIGRMPSGALLFDDYAHHPTEIQKTLQAFRQSFPKEKIICVFQPHTYSRTKKLFDEFTHAFSGADLVIMTEIYASAREDADPTVSSKNLTLAMRRYQKNILYLPKMANVIEYIAQNAYGEDTVIITMGAGDIYTIAEKLEVEKDE